MLHPAIQNSEAIFQGGFHMAERSEQGTGKHPHKSSEEPWRHDECSKSEHRSESHSEHSSENRHASSDSGREGESRHASSGDSGREESRRDEREHERDLKEREYRDKDGNIHHHTRTAEAVKDKERKAA